MGALGVGAGGGVAGGVVAVEVCAPLLLLCWLCCWPDDASSESSTSTGKHPRKPVVSHESVSSRRRSSELVGRRVASSAVSLHLPGTSGHAKQPLSAHRSHEEIPSRLRCTHEPAAVDEDGRYHSAPSVIDEVIHRRDWDRSTRELYIPLRPDADIDHRSESPSPDPQPEGSTNKESSTLDVREKITCKKHYTNIKSSKNKLNKESNKDDVKDTDATESGSNFYIGETRDEASELQEREEVPELVVSDDKIKSVYKAKDDKQSINESIKIKERPIGSVAEDFEELGAGAGAGLPGCYYEEDRSGAWHSAAPHSPAPRALYPPPSVALVGYEGAACYLTEEPRLPQRTRRDPAAPGAPGGAWPRSAGGASWAGARARHASDGDILAPTHRPESGAFSESDLDLEPESEELPPPYHELEECAITTTTHSHSHSHSHTETAI